ncbi:MAG: hypothetical protein CR996_01440 [Draconibacterium sp.]|nr:MAG: hypothetical protein CR996_01440 [Draconibacterium sp.]PIF05572.1 MAG: hypothetical protein CSA36_06155 [Draconibacterium sp.]
MKRYFFIFIILMILICPTSVFSQINVDSSGKYLVETSTGKPFFWLGDTGWELFHRLTREEAIYYLDKRKSQGFNVIQAVVLAENNGLKEPNRYGDVPFLNLDPTQWAVTKGANPDNELEYDYWDNVDFVIKEAAKRNLYIGLLPTWGDKVAHLWGEGPIIFNKENALIYATKLAERYKDQWNIIWILGGDRPVFYDKNEQHYNDTEVWCAMAKGLQDVCGEDVFITYHPGGQCYGSSEYIHNKPWLKMNGIQSGHGSRFTPIWEFIGTDLAKKPEKPTMDLEPCYEDHPVNPWDDKWTRASRGFFSDYDVRARMYRGVFAGGCGTTYGHHSIWQFLNESLYPPIFTGDTAIYWKDALEAKGAYQIHNLKNLMESYPDFNRIVDTALVVSCKGKDYRNKIVATKNIAGTYAMIYLPQPLPVTIDTRRLNSPAKKAKWFNPVNGKITPVKLKRKQAIQTFVPPADNPKDWVLILETTQNNFK